MKKNLIKEDIHKMMGLISYDRGKTLTENKEHNKEQSLDEIAGFTVPTIAKYLGAAGLGYLTAKSAPTIYKGLSTFATRAARMMGTALNDIKMEKVLSPSTWANINKTFNDLEAAFKVQKGFLRTKIEFIGANASRNIASSLEDNMEGLDPTGAGERNVIRTYGRIPTVFDAIGVSAAFGTRDGETLTQWLSGDGISYSDLERILRGKTYIIFEGKGYKDLKSAMVAMTKALASKSKSDEIKQKGTDEAGMAKDKEEMVAILVAKFGECVRGPLEDGEVKYHPTSGRRNIRVREGGMNIAVFDNGEYWDANAPTGKKYVRGVTVLLPCEEVAAAEEVNERYYFGGSLLEQFRIQDADGNKKTVGIKRAPSDDAAGEEDGGGSSSGGRSSSGGGSRYTRTDVTYEDVAAGKGEFKRGDRGDGVKKAQEALNKSDKVNPKLKVDGIFGGKTEEAIKQAGGDKVFNKAVIDMLGGKSEGNVASKEQKDGGEKIDQAEANELDKVTIEKEGTDKATIQDQIADLQQAISQQPTKDECKDLIATAAAGIKAGVKVNDLGSLKQCFNSYNFGLSRSAMKVKRTYGIKGKGN